MIKLKSLIKEELLVERKYKLGDQWRKDFDYEGMVKMGTKSKVKDGLKKLEKLFSSFEDVNYHTVAKPLWDAVESLRFADKVPEKVLKKENEKIAASHLKKFNKLCKDELRTHLKDH